MSERLNNAVDNLRHYRSNVMILLRIRHALQIFCAAAAVLLILCGSAHAQKAHPWEKLRAEQIAAARREGIPLSRDDLRGKPVPADQNAATYLEQIAALDNVKPVTTEELDALGHLGTSTVTPDQIAAARKAFEAHRDRYRLVQLVARCAAYSSKPDNLTVGEIILPDELPRLARFRDCGRWLSYKALLLAADGKPLDGLKVAALAFNTAHLAVSVGPLISYLVGMAVEPMGIKTMRVILDRSKGDPIVAAAVEKAIQARPATHLSGVMRAEVAEYLSNSQSVRKGAAKDAGKNPEFLAAVRNYNYPRDPQLAAARMFDMNDAHYIAFMRRIIPVADLPYPQALAAIRSVKAGSKALENDPDYKLAVMCLNTWEELPSVGARHIAFANVITAYAAVLAWKAQNGKVPETLAEAMNPPILDPFDLKPLRYRIEGAGFVIYSVGESGHFDGGKPGVNPPVKESVVRWN